MTVDDGRARDSGQHPLTDRRHCDACMIPQDAFRASVERRAAVVRVAAFAFIATYPSLDFYRLDNSFIKVIVRQSWRAFGSREHSGEGRPQFQVAVQTRSVVLATETAPAVKARAPAPAAIKSHGAGIGVARTVVTTGIGIRARIRIATGHAARATAFQFAAVKIQLRDGLKRLLTFVVSTWTGSTRRKLNCASGSRIVGRPRVSSTAPMPAAAPAPAPMAAPVPQSAAAPMIAPSPVVVPMVAASWPCEVPPEPFHNSVRMGTWRPSTTVRSVSSTPSSEAPLMRPALRASLTWPTSTWPRRATTQPLTTRGFSRTAVKWSPIWLWSLER